MSNEIEMHRLTLHMPSRTVMQGDVRSAGNRWPVMDPAFWHISFYTCSRKDTCSGRYVLLMMCQVEERLNTLPPSRMSIDTRFS